MPTHKNRWLLPSTASLNRKERPIVQIGNPYVEPEDRVVPHPEQWRTTMSCKESDRGANMAFANTPDEIEEMLSICRDCPSLSVCELWAWENRGDVVGVVGGAYYSPSYIQSNDLGIRFKGKTIRDLFWLEGRAWKAKNPGKNKTMIRNSDVGLCEICEWYCAGKCDRIEAIREAA